MTIDISNNDPRIAYSVASGVTQTSFAIPFEFFDDSDLNVYVDGTLKTITTDYTVVGGDGSTGTLNISVTGASGGSTVVITRDITIERTTDFTAGIDINRAALNTQLDTLTAIAADLQDKVDRSLKLTDYDLDAELTLPDVNTRKGKTLAFDTTTGDVGIGPSISDVQTISAASADIARLADIEDGTLATDAIQTAATNATAITTVSGSIANVNTVSTNIADVNSVATNMAEVLTADTNAATATTKAAEASTSATAALASQNAAATSEANAATSESNAATSATNAASSASASASSATASLASQTASATSETNAAASAAAAATSETNAATSETNAATSATASATSASASSASATSAATSATNASTSAAAASASQIAAAASAASAANAYDTFDDRYLGSKTSDPTLDNDGNALVQGALYFNSTANEMRVYDGGNWIAASSAGGASLYEYFFTATASQTTFSGADDKSNTLSYTQDNLIVTLNGVVLENGVDYTANNGTSIVLASGAAVNDELNVIAFKTFTTADMVPASTGGTFYGSITATSFNGDGSSLSGIVPATGGTFSGSVTATSFIGDGSSLTGIEGVPSGIIAMWSGAIGSIPTGWVLCDGNNSTPDLRDRFIVGAGSTYAVGNTGGAASVALSESELPSHTHGVGSLGGSTNTAGAHSHTVKGRNDTYVGGAAVPAYQGNQPYSTQYWDGTNTAGAHSHSLTLSGATAATGSGSAHENRPPYYALAYIMKT